MAEKCQRVYWLTWLVLICCGRWTLGQLPVPCTDLQPIYLLHLLSRDPFRMPHGLEIIYDEDNSLHAFRLTPRAFALHIPSSSIFTFCNYFPEEYSIFITILTPPSSVNSIECLLSLKQESSQNTLLGLTLYKGKLQFEYTDRSRRQQRVIEFDILDVFDARWHTMVLSVAGNVAVLTIDCGIKIRRRIRRSFPAFLNVRATNIHVGNCNKKDHLFTGLLHQLFILPGSDASVTSCDAGTVTTSQILTPKSASLISSHISNNHISNEIRADGDVLYSSESWCTWKDTGKLWFDVYQGALKVCYSGLWQAILQPPHKRYPKRLDYLVWYQDIITAAPTIDIEIFNIPNEGLFMATASYSDQRMQSKQQSTVFKWVESRFIVYQNIHTIGAQAWEHFTINNQFFLAVANLGRRRDHKSKSVIYQWHWRRRKFRVFQKLTTWAARDLEYFEIDGEHYLAVANHVMGQNHSIHSDIYRWDEESGQFHLFQKLPTVGAYDWTYFQVEGFHLLVVANSFTGPPVPTTRTESVIFLWQNGHFIPFQHIQTTGATDWEFFTQGDDAYLVVANAYNYGPHITNVTHRYQTNSTIYKLNIQRQHFQVYQQIVTYSAVDWEVMHIGDDTFLIVSNAQQDDVAGGDDNDYFPEDGARSASVIYRWKGVEKFVARHYLAVTASADWESFKIGDQVFLVYANAKDNISQVFRVKYS